MLHDTKWLREEWMSLAEVSLPLLLKSAVSGIEKCKVHNQPLACRWKWKGRCETERQPCQGWWWGPRPVLLVSQKWSGPARHPGTWSPIKKKVIKSIDLNFLKRKLQLLMTYRWDEDIPSGELPSCHRRQGLPLQHHSSPSGRGMRRVQWQTGAGRVPLKDLENRNQKLTNRTPFYSSHQFVHHALKRYTKSFAWTLTNHCLYTVAHQHRQEAMVRGSASAVDDVWKLGRPLQMDNRS